MSASTSQLFSAADLRKPEILIERWSNVARVLDAMPEHDRQRHFDMGAWGYTNECGTIACAAGHCGLDAWFRERGFTMDLDEDSGEPDITNVNEFFGSEGSSQIFLNTAQRPVETVLGEVRAYINKLQTIAHLTKNVSGPVIGEEWPEQGGVFAGVYIDKDGTAHELIVGPERGGDGVRWDDAVRWASSLNIGGHNDFTLPNRIEQAVLFDRVRDLFQPRAYWSGEQYASGSDNAWNQYFYYGHQHYWLKSNQLRARAVRRLPL